MGLGLIILSLELWIIIHMPMDNIRALTGPVRSIFFIVSILDCNQERRDPATAQLTTVQRIAHYLVTSLAKVIVNSSNPQTKFVHRQLLLRPITNDATRYTIF